MPIVHIHMWEGRSAGDKEKLMAAVTKTVCETMGCPPQAVEIVISDVPKANWGKEGVPATKWKLPK